MINLLEYFIFALCPLYIIRFVIPFSNLPTTLLEIMLWVYFILTFVKFIKNDLPWNKLRSHFDLPIGLLLIAGIISILITPDKYGGLGIFRAYFLEPVVFYYCYLFNKSKNSVKAVFWGLVISASWLAILGLIQKLTGQFTFAPHELEQGRITAVYNSANALALYIGPIIFLIMGIFFQSKKNIKILLGSIAIFLTLIIFWTRSRGGLVAEIISFLIFAYGLGTLRYQKFKKYWIMVPVFLAILTTLFFYTMYHTYHSSTAMVTDDKSYGDTLEIRYKLWKGTVGLLKDHPILGAGLNGFKEIYGAEYRLSSLQEQFQYPHNIVLNFWSETGLLGVGAFIILMFRVFKNFTQNFLKLKNKIFGLGICCAFSYMIIHGLVDVPYFKNDLSLQFFGILGMLELWLQQETIKV